MPEELVLEEAELLLVEDELLEDDELLLEDEELLEEEELLLDEDVSTGVDSAPQAVNKITPASSISRRCALDRGIPVRMVSIKIPSRLIIFAGA